MTSWRGHLLLALLAAVAACARPAPPRVTARSDTAGASDTVESRRGRRFYAGRPYGSESQFNPVSLIVNGGFDQLRTVGAQKRLARLPYAEAASNVLYSVANAERVLRRYGWSRWVRNELLPLSGKGEGGGQWAPNYQLHLLAGGMTSARMTEWYAQHGVQHPALMSAATVYAWHVLTEVVENGNRKRHDADAVTDLLIFDSASILLWRLESVQRLFGETLEMTNWPGQPSIAAPHGTIENVHQTAMLRAPLPRIRDWRVVTTFGGSFLAGLSRRTRGAEWLSVTGGWDPADNPVIDTVTGRKTVTLLPNAGIFYDREGSLLVSALVRWGRPELLTVNVYPGTMPGPGARLGLWGQLLRDGEVRLGLASPWGIGAGWAGR